MKISALFSGIRYIGKAEGDRKTYYVFEADLGYIIVTPSSGTAFNMSVVDAEGPEVISKTFRGKRLTSVRLRNSNRRADLFAAPFATLNTLYVMVALGRARKLKRREGKAMVFKIK